MFSSVNEATSGFLLALLCGPARWRCSAAVPLKSGWCVLICALVPTVVSLFFFLIRYGADHPLSPWKRCRDGRRGELMLPAHSTFD